MRMRFEVVTRRQQVSYKCTSCGKSRVKSVCVEHTINPFNRNAKGLPKTRDEVTDDVRQVLAEKVAAVKAGMNCTKCEVA